ncbi:MAG: FMN-binding glutamate synthase family protein [Firmicutes bacterium]|nr:FMN-binding glutamate synthase family protein [Bacillota bacterium]
MPFWSLVAALVIAIFVALAMLGLVLLFAQGPMRRWVARTIESWLEAVLRRSSQAYPSNPMGLLPVVQKVGALGLMELRIRATTGQPPSRPMGSPLPLSPWDRLMLGFSHLQPMPTADDTPVDLSVVVGPKAKRPLKVPLPVFIAPMSYGGALSLKARIALAKAAGEVGTATNSGEGVFIAEERQWAKHYIMQYHRGTWPHSPQNQWEVLKQADAIEIQLGQGAQGSAPMRDQPQAIHPEMQRRFGLKPGEPATISARLKGIDDPKALIALVKRLKQEFEVPVGVKLAATHRLEQELEILLDAELDFITLDGAEGGTHGGPPILQDAMGLPTLWAIARAHRWLERQGATDRVSLLATGGLIEPGDFLKALALGATACYSGTPVALALLCNQIDEAVMATAPAYALILQSTESLNDRLDIEQAKSHVVRLFSAWRTEWDLAMRAMGKTRIDQLTRADLVALERSLAQDLEIAYVGGEEPANLGPRWWAGGEEPASTASRTVH